MKHAVKKLGMMLLTMLIVSFLAFLAFQVIPGDPTNTILGTDATPEQVAALRAQLGLDRPFFVRYFDWLLNFIVGEFGTSYSYSMPVADMLSGKLGVTLLLAALSFVLTVVVSIPVGILCADRGGWLDKLLTVLGQVTMAVPPFFIGILLTYLFGLILQWFTPGEFIAPSVDFGGSVAYLIYPAIAIALPRIAMTVKMLRSGILGELNKDYVRTAHSRGNDRGAILYRHVLRNAVVPTVAFLAMTIADIVAGSVVIEQVFAIPGMGRLLFSSISNRDYPVVQAVIVLMAFWVVLINFLADMLNQRLDPRLRLQ
jgi:ABC-type dipeptide/oligopeptide/nickel transport system permease component